jgi:hypothetical protein
MPILSYFFVVVLILAGLLYCADAVILPSPVKFGGSQKLGLPAPYKAPIVKRVPALHFLCLFREKLFVAYVICNTDRWTPLSHNSTCVLIPSGEIVDANANFVLLSGCRNRSFWRAGSGQHSIGIEAAVGIAKDWRSTAVQGPAR